MNSSSSRALFDGSLTGGLYRIVGPTSEILAGLRAAGWRTGSLSKGDTMPEFLANVGAALQFPAYYGANLDALWDCLTDMSEPTALLWTSWHELAIFAPRDWATVVTLLEERTALDPAFALVLG